MQHIPLDSLFRPMMPAPHNTYVETTVVSQSCRVALKLNLGIWKYIFVTIVNCDKEENTIYTVAMSLIWLYLPPTMPVSSEYWYINVCWRDSAFTFKIIEIIKLLLIQRVLRISSEKTSLQYVEWKWNCYFCTMIADWLVASLQTHSTGCMAAVCAYNLGWCWIWWSFCRPGLYPAFLLPSNDLRLDHHCY